MTSGLHEEYTNTKYVKILTEDRLHLPGLSLFGRQIRKAAIDSLPPHHHDNKFEIVYVVSGNPCFYVGEKLYTLSGGDIFITKPHEMHSTSSQPVSISELYWMQLDLTRCPDALFLDRAASQHVCDGLCALPSPVVTSDLLHMKFLMQEAFQSALSGSHPQLTAQYLTLFLYLTLEYAAHTTSRLTPDIQIAVDYIHDHITEKIALEDLASACYLSTSQFKQKFKRQLGVAPRQFINSQKTEYAKELLSKGYTTFQTAEALHYDNPSYFITVFRRYTSCTPGEYRKKAGLTSADES